jgi:hypothetical protein
LESLKTDSVIINIYLNLKPGTIIVPEGFTETAEQQVNLELLLKIPPINSLRMAMWKECKQKSCCLMTSCWGKDKK